MDCVSLALTPPWQVDRLLLVRAADAIRLCREGAHEQLPWRESTPHIDELGRRDMGSLREFVSQAGLTSFPLAMFDDYALLSLLRDSLRSRDLVVLRAPEGARSGETVALLEQRRLE